MERGKGAYVWDYDGNKYVDYVLGLMPVILGYCDPDVDEAIRNQLNNGIIFSLPSALEVQLSEKLIELIFNKNLLNENGIIILHRNKTAKEKLPNYFEIVDERTYGMSKIIFGKFLS